MSNGGLYFNLENILNLPLEGSFQNAKTKKIGPMMKKLKTLFIGCTDDFMDFEWILNLKLRLLIA